MKNRDFAVSGDQPFETVEWSMSEDSTEEKAVFFAYDANFCPLPNFSEWKKEEYKEKHRKKALEFMKGFKGEIWLDDVKIKEKDL